MTKTAALHSFFAGFGLTAYEENSVYALEGAPAFPYLTYEVRTDSFGDGADVNISASLWYRSTAWTGVNEKTEEISASIGRAGTKIKIDGGYMLIMRGSPFAQSLADPSDSMIKRKVLNLQVRFYTNN